VEILEVSTPGKEKVETTVSGVSALPAHLTSSTSAPGTPVKVDKNMQVWRSLNCNAMQLRLLPSLFISIFTTILKCFERRGNKFLDTTFNFLNFAKL
jgi:hypothetical protein